MFVVNYSIPAHLKYSISKVKSNINEEYVSKYYDKSRNP